MIWPSCHLRYFFKTMQIAMHRPRQKGIRLLLMFTLSLWKRKQALELQRGCGIWIYSFALQFHQFFSSMCVKCLRLLLYTSDLTDSFLRTHDQLIKSNHHVLCKGKTIWQIPLYYTVEFCLRRNVSSFHSNKHSTSHLYLHQ